MAGSVAHFYYSGSAVRRNRPRSYHVAVGSKASAANLSTCRGISARPPRPDISSRRGPDRPPLPRLFAAQPRNCSPIKPGVDTPVARDVHKTIAEGTAIRHPMRLREIVGALRESGGGTVALTEDEIIAALRRLARQGLFAKPTSASAAAALDKLAGAGAINPGETTVMILTGTGLKAASTVADLVQEESAR